LLLALAGFTGLGVWQVRRMHWKHDLIARVDARVHAAPIALPGDAGLAPAASDGWDYLRVRFAGVYAGSRTALVRAATDLGTGYWAMTPMRLADGRTIWVDRGFVPAGTTAAAAGASVPEGPIVVVGLLRPSEPGGSLLQSNRPQEDRWYSRDIVALSRTRGTGPTVPAFVDEQQEAGRAPQRGVAPVPGLTVVRFPDNHLSYALTWFALAALSALGLGAVWRRAGAAQ
jgi:surfeit locus 1 family protein